MVMKIRSRSELQAEQGRIIATRVENRAPRSLAIFTRVRYCNEMALITIAKLHDMTLAQLVRIKFESEEIPVHLGSEGFASLLGAETGFSAVRVQVPAFFETRAREVYEELMERIESEG